MPCNFKGIRLAVPNRQVRYENQTIQLDDLGTIGGIAGGVDHQRQSDFNFANAGFSHFGDEDATIVNNQANKSAVSNSYNYTKSATTANNTMTTTSGVYYPDFTGSREVGIDVGGGPSSPAVVTLFEKTTKQSDTPPELPPLPAKFAASSGGLIVKSAENISKNEQAAPKLPPLPSSIAKKKADSDNDDDEEDHDINFSYFDMYKKSAIEQTNAAQTPKKEVAESALQIVKRGLEKEVKPLQAGS